MGQNNSIQKINFEDVKKSLNTTVLINTLNETKQDCLIIGTIHARNETDFINELIKKRNYNIPLILYGMNHSDDTIHKKYNQLVSLGFTNVYIYVGGLFEWLCLQDIYGDDEFPTTTKEPDLLQFRPSQYFIPKITNM